MTKRERERRARESSLALKRNEERSARSVEFDETPFYGLPKRQKGQSFGINPLRVLWSLPEDINRATTSFAKAFARFGDSAAEAACILQRYTVGKNFSISNPRTLAYLDEIAEYQYTSESVALTREEYSRIAYSAMPRQSQIASEPVLGDPSVQEPTKSADLRTSSDRNYSERVKRPIGDDDDV